MIIGVHSRENDLVVNPIKGKQLTNVRASGTDEAVRLVPPIQLTLESAIEFIADDELVEITPKSIRLRKRHLKEHERKRAARTSSRGLNPRSRLADRCPVERCRRARRRAAGRAPRSTHRWRRPAADRGVERRLPRRRVLPRQNPLPHHAVQQPRRDRRRVQHPADVQEEVAARASHNSPRSLQNSASKHLGISPMRASSASYRRRAVVLW